MLARLHVVAVNAAGCSAHKGKVAAATGTHSCDLAQLLPAHCLQGVFFRGAKP